MKKTILTLIIAIFGVTVVSWSSTVYIPQDKIQQARQYCQENGLNEDVCIFVDFSKHRLRKRCVIYDLKNNHKITSSLCASGKHKNKFSNTPGSNLSSLGHYAVTESIYKMSNGGRGIVVDGLDSTNSNARQRLILIHTSRSLALGILFKHSKTSWGCFVVDKKAYKKTTRQAKPMLLWAYR